MTEVKRRKYLILLDTEGERGGLLFSRRVYTLNQKFGDKLVKKGRAEPHEIKKFVTIKTASGKTKTLSWGDYLRRRRRKR